MSVDKKSNNNMIQDLVNIVICYANEDEVINYAKQLEKQTCSNRIELIVVVNRKSKDLNYLEEGLSKLDLKHCIFDSEENLGYLNGLLYGYLLAKRNVKWYVLSNTDIQISKIDFFELFLKKDYISDDNIWLVGPSVYTPSKEIYSNPYLRIRPNRKFYTFRNIGMIFPHIYELMFKLKAKVRKQRKEEKTELLCSVYAIHGSFMFLHNDLLSELSKREPWELLYDEEQYIAEIVRINRKIALYDSTIQVIHLEGASTGRIAVRNRYRRMRHSNNRILREFY